MAWIQDGGINPGYATFNNTALDAIFFNGVQVWASQYSFSITVSYKVGADGEQASEWEPSQCQYYYNDNLLVYVSRFNLSVSNVVGCDKIECPVLGDPDNNIDPIYFDDTSALLEALWSNRNEWYCPITDSDRAESFYIDRFNMASNRWYNQGDYVPLYDNGTYTPISSWNEDPVLSMDWDGTVVYPTRALHYSVETNLPGPYFYMKNMDTARRYSYGLYSDGVQIPLRLTRGSMTKYLRPYIGVDIYSKSGQYTLWDISAFDRSAAGSSTIIQTGDW